LLTVNIDNKGFTKFYEELIRILLFNFFFQFFYLNIYFAVKDKQTKRVIYGV